MISIAALTTSVPTTIDLMGFILPKTREIMSWKHTIMNGLAAVYRSIAGLVSTTRFAYNGSTL